MAAITGILGLYALHGMGEAGRPVEPTSGKPLAAIDRVRTMWFLATLDVVLLGWLIALIRAREPMTPAGALDPGIRVSGHDEPGYLLAAMAARRMAESQLVDAIETNREGVALVDAAGRVVTANARIGRLFPGGRMIPSEIAGRIDPVTGEFRLDDGSWLHLSKSPTRDGGFLLIVGDISGLKNRETALRAACDRAEAANRAKTDFLTTMSHEVRTPLSAMIGFSEMIAMETFGPAGAPQYKEFAGDILHAGRHLMDVIAGILDIAKAQSGTIELRRRAIQPWAVVRDAVRIVREKAHDGDIDLTMTIEDNLPPILADTVRMRQILLNLLSNAIKFTPAGGTIGIEARAHTDGIALIVTDTGAGMAPEDIPRALQPFVQVDTSLNRRHRGTGLGLPLTKVFVELHGGRLEIDSTPNAGTTVTVILPALRRTEPAARLTEQTA